MRRTLMAVWWLLGFASFAFAGPGNAIWLIKTDSLGDTLWSSNICYTGLYSYYSKEYPNWITISSDGGYVMEGGEYLSHVNRYSIKTDSFCRPLYCIRFLKPHSSERGLWGISHDIKEIRPGEYLVREPTKLDTVSVTKVTEMAYPKILELGLTSDWSAFAGEFLATPDSFTISLEYGKGEQTDTINQSPSYMLIKRDSAGSIVWQRNIPYDYHFFDISPTRDEGYVLVGYGEEYFPPLYREVVLMKFDSLGQTLWTRTFNRDSNGIGYAVRQTPDGGYIIVAESEIILP